jgi:hypothetical protein
MDTTEQLAWEARQRPRAAMAAFAAALLTLGAAIYNVSSYSGFPQASLVESLSRLEQAGPIGRLTSLHIPLYEWFADHLWSFVIAAVIGGAGALATAGVLTVLAFATAARRAEFPRMGLYVGVVGGALLTVGMIAVAFGRDQIVNDFLSGPRTVDSFNDPKPTSFGTMGQIVELVGRFTLASAFVLVSLNAMRCGLLTRFLGILGIIAGVLLIIPIGSPLPVVQFVWLMTVGLLLLGRSPGGTPPAWTAGEAIPWMSTAESREARLAGRGRRAPAAKEETEPEPAEATPKTSSPSPATSKKKRKRRG